MIHNQNGFTYPITLCMMILLSTILIMRIDHFLIEKRMLKETENILKQDYYLLSTMDQLQSYLSTNEDVPVDGNFDYKDGQATYQIVNITGDTMEMMITLKVGGQESVFIGNAFYDLNLNKFIKWYEVN